MNCPDCGGEMWNNADKKASGAFKPNSPDFSCKDKNCKKAIWLEPKGGGAPPPPPKPRQDGGWGEVAAIYGRAAHEASKYLGPTRTENEALLIPTATAFALIAIAKSVPAAG